MPETLTSIGANAFAYCPNLKKILIDRNVTSIAQSAFSNSPDTVIYCTSDSYAHDFAEENRITHVLIDVNIGYYLGDVNCDGLVNIFDVTYIQRYLGNIETPAGCDFTHGDVDGDLDTTIVDATLIMRYLSRLDTDFPINTWVDKYEKHEF